VVAAPGPPIRSGRRCAPPYWTPSCRWADPPTWEAISAIDHWRQEVTVRAKPASGLYKGWLGRLPGLCLRLATVLTYLEWCGGPEDRREPQEIDALAIARARRFLIEYTVPMARRVFGEMAPPEEERDARALAKWLVAQEPVPEVLNERELASAPPRWPGRQGWQAPEGGARRAGR
jgi:Protein of unknown function (DUF3987)